MLNLQTIYETEITGYTSDGRGVAHIEGCAVFIPNAIAGERCTVRVTHIGKHSAVGKIEQILEKSPTGSTGTALTQNSAAAAPSGTWTTKRSSG